MGKAKDLTGQRFGRLVAIEATAERCGSGSIMWRCRCDCGKSVRVTANNLCRGLTKSCGCLNKELTSARRSKDLTGCRFERLTVMEKFQDKDNRIKWKCRCDCGNIVCISTENLCCGRTKSCGCLSRELTSKRFLKHNATNSRLYGVWFDMKRRCSDDRRKCYKDYGGRGITVCEEWREDFSRFLEWALANGYDENAPRGKCTLDRIDNDKGYSPENCRWVDMKVQNNNKRRNKK